MVQQTQEKDDAIYESDNPIISRAKSVAILLSERAQTVDRARELPIETVHDLHEAGLLTLNIPLVQGGLEADLATQMAVFEIIGGACASTAWCLGNHIATGSIVQNLLGGDSRPYIEAVVEEGAILAHAQIPAGTTRAVPGGMPRYRQGRRVPFRVASCPPVAFREFLAQGTLGFPEHPCRRSATRLDAYSGCTKPAGIP